MIVRMWHGRVPTAKAARYRAFLAERAIPDYRSVPGNLAVQVLERAEGEVTHFVTLTHWSSMDAIRAFAGDDVGVAKYYPEDREFLLEFEPGVVHHRVVGDARAEAAADAVPATRAPGPVATLFALLGVVVLGVGAVLHLAWGYPPLAAAVESGAIVRAPGMAPGEILAVWVAGGLLMLGLAVVPLLFVRRRSGLRTAALVSGLAALGCAAVVAAFVAAMHPAIVIFALSGMAFCLAAVVA